MLSTRKAAEALDVSTKTIIRMIARGDLPGACKISDGEGRGRHEWRIPQADIDAIKARRKPTPPTN